MTRHIMLSFLSPYKLEGNRLINSKYYGADNYHTTGCHTNEPAVKYIAYQYPLDIYFLFCSDMMNTKLKYQNEVGSWIEQSHLELFAERVKAEIPSLSGYGGIRAILYHEAKVNVESLQQGLEAGTNTDLEAIDEMAREVRSYAEPILQRGEQVVLHVDMTGGFRHASMLILAVVELLKYTGITIGKVMYTNYNVTAKVGQLEEVTDIHSVMQLVAGAEAFVNYGRVEIINNYFSSSQMIFPKQLNDLLKAMNRFSEALSLCRTGVLTERLKDLQRKIVAYELVKSNTLQEKLFSQLLSRIKQEYASIIDGNDKLAIIQWCVKKGFMQQAMTFYTEWVPEYIVEAQIVYPNSTELQEKCENMAPEYVPWQKYLLSSYTLKKNAGTAKPKNFISCFREYCRTREEVNLQRAFAFLKDDGQYSLEVLASIEMNDELVQEMKNSTMQIADIRKKYPLLLYVVDKIYNSNSIKETFKDYWLSKLDTANIYKRMGYFDEASLRGLFKLDELEKPQEIKQQMEELVPFPKASERMHCVAGLLNKGLVKSLFTDEVALKITYEYNQIREVRNQINHALDANDGMEMKAVEAMIINNILNLKQYGRV